MWAWIPWIPSSGRCVPFVSRLLILLHYALHNISAHAHVTLLRSCQTLSYVSKGAIFIYVGMDTLDPRAPSSSRRSQIS
jgi:hypothetical protein